MSTEVIQQETGLFNYQETFQGIELFFTKVSQHVVSRNYVKPSKVLTLLLTQQVVSHLIIHRDK